MRRAFSLLTLIVLVLSLVSCSGKKPEKTSSTSNLTIESYPLGNPDNYTESDFDTGMRLTLSLRDYTKKIVDVYTELGGDADKFSYENWEKIKSDKKYSYCYLKSGKITLTATVEKTSKCLVNVGCGANKDVFKKYKRRVLRVSAICAIAAGGYDADDTAFFSTLFNRTRKHSDHCYWFNHSVYKYDLSDKNETVLFRVIPAEDSKRDEWKLTDYKEAAGQSS